MVSRSSPYIRPPNVKQRQIMPFKENLISLRAMCLGLSGKSPNHSSEFCLPYNVAGIGLN